MKKGIIAVLVLVLAGGAGAGVYYHWFYQGGQSSQNGRVSSDSEDAVYVDSVSMLAGLGSGSGLIQRYAGVVEPQQTWEVKLQNERTVKECYVKEGDEVKEGQKLFIYDTTDDEDKLAQAQIDLERCQNDIDTAKATKEQLEKEKTKASADDKLSYTTRIMAEENTIKQSEYEYKTKELEIETLKENISDSAVYCEIDGVVKSINDPNSSSSMSDSSDSAYIQVLEVGDYRIKGTVNEQNINQISEGMEVIVHSRVDEDVSWHGTISEINRDKGETNSDSYAYFGSSSDSSTSSTNYPFYVDLDNSDDMMLGQHVYLEPDVGQEDKKEGIWLDDYYFITEEDGSSYVWAASSQNTLEKREVTLGDYDEDMATYQVLEGLDEEDYITVPSDELTEGLPVIYNDVSSDDTYGDLGMDGMDDFGDGVYED
ncbi:MAG: efflux RND transporter periplasmic adaptor subunit, partial [Lachnospiraceae bacterium]|nr:efflux RND transporter periplasmic adaptor subunit [Lachnospiraceae bacterium]